MKLNNNKRNKNHYNYNGMICILWQYLVNIGGRGEECRKKKRENLTVIGELKINPIMDYILNVTVKLF